MRHGVNRWTEDLDSRASLACELTAAQSALAHARGEVARWKRRHRTLGLALAFSVLFQAGAAALATFIWLAGSR